VLTCASKSKNSNLHPACTRSAGKRVSQAGTLLVGHCTRNCVTNFKIFFGNNSDIERSLQAGFSEHLIKPIKLEKLEAAIEWAIAS
jgi:hypothetical protein